MGLFWCFMSQHKRPDSTEELDYWINGNQLGMISSFQALLSTLWIAFERLTT